jgi:UDP-glucose 4-epimerase
MLEWLSLQDKVVVVTGGAGFIGSHLIEALLANGCREVRALDNLACGNWNNLSFAEGDERLTKITCDFSEASLETLTDTLQGADYLFHLAAEKHNQSIKTPERVIQVNITGTHTLYQAAVRAGVRKVVFTSSLYAYGATQPPAMVETQLAAPWTIYGMSKLAGENLCLHFERQHQLAFTTVRLFFIYGPRQFAGMGYKSVIVSNFERMRRGEAPVIFGDGEQALDYVYVKDCVEALIAALNPEVNGQMLNIASGQGVSINALTRLMQGVANDTSAPVFAPKDWTHGTYRAGNPDFTRQTLGWTAKTPLQVGLQQTFNWMKTPENITPSQVHCV